MIHPCTSQIIVKIFNTHAEVDLASALSPILPDAFV